MAYHIYSHDAGKSEDPTTHVLAAGSGLDTFIGSLVNKGITLDVQPNPTANAASSDPWATWMANLDPQGALSLTWDSVANKNIQSFQYTFSQLFASKSVEFSSSAACINNSFGAPEPIGGPSDAKVPVPGIRPTGDILYCGLNTEGLATLSGKVKDIFTFAGIPELLNSLPKGMPDVAVSLDPKSAAGNRNALWVRPSFSFQTNVRLAFTLADKSSLDNLLDSTLPGFKLPALMVVGTKVITQGKTALGTTVIKTGSVVFTAQGSIQPSNKPSVGLLASIEFKGYTVAFTIVIDNSSNANALDSILVWLAGLVHSDDLESGVNDLLGKDSILSGVNLRRIRLALDVSDPNKPVISSFGLDIEVAANFGESSNKQPVLFLLTYFYSRGVKPKWSIAGSFWPATSAPDDTSPYYEKWSTLTQPINAAKSINLVTLIKGQSITNIPSTVPTDITRAAITLTNDSFSFGATVKANPPSAADVPFPVLNEIGVDASYTWGKSSAFTLAVKIAASLVPSSASKHPVPATLRGEMKYDSSQQSWQLDANLQGLYASALYSFLDASSGDQVVPLIDSIEINQLSVSYSYDKGTGTHCHIHGLLRIAELELTLDFNYQKSWTFIATLAPSSNLTTLGAIIESIAGGAVDIPEFAANMKLDKTDSLTITIDKRQSPAAGDKVPEGETTTGTALVTTSGGSTASANPPGSSTSMVAASDPPSDTEESFLFSADLKIASFEVIFVQYRGAGWASSVASKRAFKAAVTSLFEVNVPLVGNITKPFDEMYFLWVQDNSGKNTPPALPGLTRDDLESLSVLALVPKDGVKEPKDTDVLVPAGSHFAVLVKGSDGKTKCILDYTFAAAETKSSVKTITGRPGSNALVTGSAARGPTTTTPSASTALTLAAAADSSASAPAPLKKTMGPLTISSVGLKYKDGSLYIILDASLLLGPLAFALEGFSLQVHITTLDKPLTWTLSANIEGLTVVFDKSPLTIAGTIRHGKSDDLEYYAGGLIVGFVPYQFMAAGFYGIAKNEKGGDFKSVFVFAKLNGPLVTFEFATISGVTGGFGYNSQIRTPAVAEVVKFPFVAPNALDGNTENALATLQALVNPSKTGGWFSPQEDTYWAAAGMKVDAFSMLSIDAVVVVQFAQSIKLGIFAVATADIPSTEAPVKFAHVELGLAITVDFAYGAFKAEGQLAPTSYILAPECHLTGGFGFCYWFDAPHADRSLVGQFVFTVGGYHQAFAVPQNYPNPPRLGISWSLGSNLSITGEAYFAITPKVCMGGGRLHAAFSAGPIEAWFDAFANFLINYKPFHFIAEAGISVGVRFNLDLLFIHTHISAEIGATLTLWGPPVAGTVHVNLWVHAFDINFGPGRQPVLAVSLPEFFKLLQQSNQNAPQANGAHTFVALTGLMNDSEKPEKKPDAIWVVRAGTLTFSISCTIAIEKATVPGTVPVTYTDNSIYAKPMHLRKGLTSELAIKTLVGQTEQNVEWIVERSLKSVPAGLWGFYEPKDDPSQGNNNIDSLLDPNGAGVLLMMGVTLRVPPPILSPDILPAFNVADANLSEIDAKRPFPPDKPSPSPEFLPVAPLTGPEPYPTKPQYDAVKTAWAAPTWDAKGFVTQWASAFGWSTSPLPALVAMPTKLKKQFDDLYVAAPLLTT